MGTRGHKELKIWRGKENGGSDLKKNNLSKNNLNTRTEIPQHTKENGGSDLNKKNLTKKNLNTRTAIPQHAKENGGSDLKKNNSTSAVPQYSKIYEKCGNAVSIHSLKNKTYSSDDQYKF